MSKFMKFWTLIICLLFIFLILLSDRVNAETMQQYYISSSILSNNTITNNINSPYSQFDFTFNNFSWSGNYNYFVGSFYYRRLSTTTNINTSIDYLQTCSSYNQGWDLEQATVHYADGSIATIDYANWQKYCEEWTTTGTTTYSQPKTENEPWFEVWVYSNDNSVLCDINENGNFKCPLSFNNANKNIQKLRIIMHETSGNTSNYLVGISRQAVVVETETTATIIQNQIQNAQQQHNDAQQQYNFISNTTIDSTTTNDINNIDTSNSDTKLAVTNFALIPLNFMQSIINSFSSSCSQVCIGECGGSSGGGHDNAWRFIFPCLEISNTSNKCENHTKCK